MANRRETVEDILGDFGFRLEWSVEDHWAAVKVFAIEARGGDDGVPLFARDQSSTFDPIETTEGAEEYLTGYVKWDGCTELDMGRPHWCGPDGYRKHCDLLKHIYIRAFELMGREPEEPWGN